MKNSNPAPRSTERPEGGLTEPAKLVLFDIDGTLLRTGGAGMRAFARAARILGRPGGTDHIHFHGRTDTAIVAEFFRDAGLSDSPGARRHFLDTYVFLLDDELSRYAGELCPGVMELLSAFEALSTPPTMGLLTGNVRLGAALKLSAQGLEGEFVVGAFGDDHESRNELAGIAQRRASERLGRRLRGEEIVVVGDTPADVACARSIQARSVAVATGSYSVDALAGCGANLVIPSLVGVTPEKILSPS